MTGSLAALGLAFIGGVFSIVALIFLNDAADAFWTAVARRREANAHTAVKTRTFADRWYKGKAADVAAIEASVARGEQKVTLTTVRAHNPRRLADFTAEQKRRRSA